MSLSWGWPLALAGLAALLVPLLLHLDRRRSVQWMRFAALRWVGAQPRPRRTWRIVEWLLLALRLLLVGVLVAWLAQPLLRGLPREARHWIAIVPGARVVPAGEAATHAVWLVADFPAVDAQPALGDARPGDAASSSPAASVSSLLRELDATLPPGDTLEVRVPRLLAGLDAAAIALSRDVRWVVDGEAVPPAAAVPAKRVLALRYASASDPALPFVRAAIKAWQAEPGLAVQLDEAAADAPVPANAAAVLRLDGTPPDAARMQSADYPRELHRELFGDPPPPDRAPADAVAPVASAAPIGPPAQPLRPWLAWLVAGLFLVERVLANGRRRGAAP